MAWEYEESSNVMQLVYFDFQKNYSISIKIRGKKRQDLESSNE